MKMREMIDIHWGSIVDMMKDDIREKVHFELAPCSNAEFLKRYCELDSELDMILWNTFRIDIDDI